MEKEWNVPAGTTMSASPSTCAEAEVETVRTLPPPTLMLTCRDTVHDFREDSGKLACAWGGSNEVTVVMPRTVKEVLTIPRSESRTQESVAKLADPADAVCRRWNAA